MCSNAILYAPFSILKSFSTHPKILSNKKVFENFQQFQLTDRQIDQPTKWVSERLLLDLKNMFCNQLRSKLTNIELIKTKLSPVTFNNKSCLLFTNVQKIAKENYKLRLRNIQPF